jgi:hypothetical protein
MRIRASPSAAAADTQNPENEIKHENFFSMRNEAAERIEESPFTTGNEP